MGEMLKAEEAFQARLLADHAVPHTGELSSKSKGRKIMLHEFLSGSLFPYLCCEVTFSYSI